MRILLTDRLCNSTAPGEHFDDGVRGLSLRITENGARAFCFMYTSPATGKRSRKTLGTYPAMTLAAARAAALEARTLVEQGSDPRCHSEGAPLYVSDLVAAYLHASKGKKSFERIERRLRMNVIPALGMVKLVTLHRRDVARCLDAISARGAMSERRHVHHDLSAMFRWAIARGDMESNPIDGLKAPAANVRDRCLTDDEIRVLWNGLDSVFPHATATKRIIKLLLLTGQRSGEVGGMKRSELDLDSRVWNLPSARTKNGKPHVVPLSRMAVDIIRQAIAEALDGENVFPGHTSLRLNNALTVARLRGKLTGEHWTPHDLRRTAISKMAEMGAPEHVLSRIANHAKAGGSASITGRVYNQHSYADEKRQALEAWADRLAQIAGENVVRLAA